LIKKPQSDQLVEAWVLRSRQVSNLPIDRVKKNTIVIVQNPLNLSEIARMLRCSSVGHLSRQFKEVTGLTPSCFKQTKAYRKRIALEDI